MVNPVTASAPRGPRCPGRVSLSGRGHCSVPGENRATSHSESARIHSRHRPPSTEWGGPDPTGPDAPLAAGEATGRTVRTQVPPPNLPAALIALLSCLYCFVAVVRKRISPRLPLSFTCSKVQGANSTVPRKTLPAPGPRRLRLLKGSRAVARGQALIFPPFRGAASALSSGCAALPPAPPGPGCPHSTSAPLPCSAPQGPGAPTPGLPLPCTLRKAERPGSLLPNAALVLTPGDGNNTCPRARCGKL